MHSGRGAPCVCDCFKPSQGIRWLRTFSNVTNGNDESEYIRIWFSSFLSQRTEFKISMLGKYLGIFMGPHAYSKVWSAPIPKYVKRTWEIAHSRMNCKLATISYNSRSIPVLGYVGQLLRPPVSCYVERALLHHLFINI